VFRNEKAFLLKTLGASRFFEFFNCNPDPREVVWGANEKGGTRRWSADKCTRPEKADRIGQLVDEIVVQLRGQILQ
jgi:hypothetical protein